MIPTHKTFFKLAIFYTYPMFLPPFVSSSLSWLGYLTTFSSALTCLRTALIVVNIGKIDFEYLFVNVVFTWTCAETCCYFTRKKSFDVYLENADEFTRSTYVNPINKNRGELLEIWGKVNPKKLVTIVFWSLFFFGGMWTLGCINKMLFYGDTLTANPFPFVAPFFNYSITSKWSYTIVDSYFLMSTVMEYIHANVAVLAILAFTRCQFLYLKAVLDDILNKDDELKSSDDELIKWWIERHSHVLEMCRQVKNLLRRHITIKYILMVCDIGFCALTFFDSNTIQTLGQKISAISFHSILFLQIGYQCDLAEKMKNAQENLFENLYKPNVIYGEKKKSYFLKMLMMNCQRPVRIRGHGMFDMGRKNYKDLSFQVYSFISSLITIRLRARED